MYMCMQRTCTILHALLTIDFHVTLSYLSSDITQFTCTCNIHVHTSSMHCIEK